MKHQSFFSKILATIFGLIFYQILFLSIIFSVVLVSSKIKKYKCKPKKNTILTIKLKGKLTEKYFTDYQFLKKQSSSISLNQIKNILKNAKNDPKIKAIKLEAYSLKSGWAQLKNLRDALRDFKSSGKPIITHGDFYSNKTYYIASVSDRIFLSPEGMFIFPGLSVGYTYYKNTLDKLNIIPLEFHVGEYKAYGEKFYRNTMSQKNREQTKAILNYINKNFLNTIALSRNTSIDKLQFIINNLSINTPKDAVKHKLIDELGYDDDIDSYLENKLLLKGKKLNYIKYQDYSKYLYDKSKKSYNNQIAVVHLEGGIKYGHGSPGESIGSVDFIELLKKIKKDKKIKGVVLRVNSPGGSVIASDKIYHEIELLNKVKPVVASIGDCAASGGYYITLACDYIFAENFSITGSIGVLAILFDISKLMNEKLGITFDFEKTGKSSDIFSNFSFGLHRPLSIPEKYYMQNIINDYYNTFIKLVSKNRKLKIETVDKISRGRVWLGHKAKEIGLVDNIGTLEDAIELAAKKANIAKNYNVFTVPKCKNLIQMFLANPKSSIKYLFYQKFLYTYYSHLQEIKKLNNLRGFLAVMPFKINIK